MYKMVLALAGMPLLAPCIASAQPPTNLQVSESDWNARDFHFHTESTYDCDCDPDGSLAENRVVLLL
jgi:hypothetical protein